MSVFTLTQGEREQALLPPLVELTAHHRRACDPYRRILDALGAPTHAQKVADLPWLPVNLLREHPLSSLPAGQGGRVLRSSGTTGPATTVPLDARSAAAERKTAVQTLQQATGPRRLPMLIADSPSVLRERTEMSMRTALALAWMQLGRDHVFMQDADGQVDLPAVRAFLSRHGRAPFLLCGVTSLLWEYAYRTAATHRLDLSHGLALHAGGWKKLAQQAVTREELRERFRQDTGLERIHDYYGMTEQGGTLFLESPRGDGLHCPDHADVIIRTPLTWEEAATGTPGLIQVVSTVPRSHPGHLLLSEDWGVVHGIDDGLWPGKRFSVLGRLERAQPRGCSDTLPPPGAEEASRRAPGGAASAPGGPAGGDGREGGPA